jgi:hypothetical protein
MTFYITEEEVWAALQVDLYENEDSPPTKEPIDRDYIATLIEAAQNRMDEHLDTKLADMDAIPSEIKLALMMDVTVNYFDRKNPVLPQHYFYLIRPFRPDTSLIV